MIVLTQGKRNANQTVLFDHSGFKAQFECVQYI
jgi:hypothetical protein